MSEKREAYDYRANSGDLGGTACPPTVGVYTGDRRQGWSGVDVPVKEEEFKEKFKPGRMPLILNPTDYSITDRFFAVERRVTNLEATQGQPEEVVEEEKWRQRTARQWFWEFVNARDALNAKKELCAEQASEIMRLLQEKEQLLKGAEAYRVSVAFFGKEMNAMHDKHLEQYREMAATIADLREKLETIQSCANEWKRSAQDAMVVIKRQQADANLGELVRQMPVYLSLLHGDKAMSHEWSCWCNAKKVCGGDTPEEALALLLENRKG